MSFSNWFLNNIWELHETFLKCFTLFFFLLCMINCFTIISIYCMMVGEIYRFILQSKNYLSRGLRLQIIFVYIVSSYHFHTIAVKPPEFSRPIRWCLYRIIIFRHNVIYSWNFPLFYLEFNIHVFSLFDWSRPIKQMSCYV